jgi:hypothetical protein
MRERHGRSNTTEYRIWRNIKARCTNPNDPAFHNYGERGITICPEWKTSFTAFLADMGLKPTPAHTIERIDNNLGYTPENCTWADRFQQAENRRNTRWLTHNGITKSLSQWAQERNIRRETLRVRLDLYHWTLERALTTPTVKPNS